MPDSKPMATSWSSGRFATANKARRAGRRPATNRRPRTVGDVYATVVKLKGELLQQASHLVARQAPVLLELQRDQMYAGLDARGRYISPRYSQDPWFKSRESAARYAAWKASLHQRRPASYLPPRPEDVPNLIINGRLIYDNLLLRVGPLAMRVDLPGFDVEAKFGPVLGFSPVVLDYYRRTYFWPRYHKIMQRIIEKQT